MTLLDALHRLEATYNVSRETIERLNVYHTLLVERSTTLSLVGRATLADAWERHFLDSAQLYPLVLGRGSILDIGTGAGFPGLVLAIMGINPMHLADNNQQKVAFLRDVADATKTLVTIHNVKAEALPKMDTAIVTSRALAPLSTLLAMGAQFHEAGAEGMFLKGRKAHEEVAEARKLWNFDLERLPSLTSPESSILRLRQIRPRNIHA